MGFLIFYTFSHIFFTVCSIENAYGFDGFEKKKVYVRKKTRFLVYTLHALRKSSSRSYAMHTNENQKKERYEANDEIIHKSIK